MSAQPRGGNARDVGSLTTSQKHAGTLTYAIIDTGTSVNVTNMTMLRRLTTRPKMAPTQARIYAYGSTTPLFLLGVIEVTVTNGNRKMRTKFHVTRDKTGTLLSCHTSEVLGLVFFAKQVHESWAEAVS